MKSFIQSKMFWTGAASVIGAGLDAYLTGGDMRTAIMAALGVLVVVLRKYTSTAIVFKSPDKARQLRGKTAVSTLEQLSNDKFEAELAEASDVARRVVTSTQTDRSDN